MTTGTSVDQTQEGAPGDQRQEPLRVLPRMWDVKPNDRSMCSILKTRRQAKAQTCKPKVPCSGRRALQSGYTRAGNIYQKCPLRCFNVRWNVYLPVIVLHLDRSFLSSRICNWEHFVPVYRWPAFNWNAYKMREASSPTCFVCAVRWFQHRGFRLILQNVDNLIRFI